MKKDWAHKTLGDVCHVYQPETLSHKHLKRGEYSVYGANGQIGWHSEYNHEEPQLILGCRGSCGTVHITAPKSWINGNAMVVQPNDEVIIRSFLSYALRGGINIQGSITGTAQPQITRTSLMPIAISYPESLPEQQRIVGILDEAFDGIATAKANAEKNLQNARALFESHLHAVFTRESDFVPLSELASDVTDGDHMPPPKSLTGIPFITIGDIVKTTRKIDFEHTFRVPQEYFDSLKPNRRPRRGDVLYTVTGATLGIPVLVTDDRDFCFQRHIGLIRPKPNVDSSWLCYAMLSPQVFSQATSGSTGAAQKTVSLSVLRKIQIPRMPLTEQRRIVRQLDALQTETRRLEALYARKLSALDELKTSLLHQAFSGQL